MYQTQSNYELLISKLDQFIRKYYINKLIKGTLYTIGVVLFAFLFINFLEYFFYFSASIRKVLFYGFMCLTLLTAWLGVFTPLLHYFKLGKIISRQEAANIIGNHFANVKDKLLNVLQLKDQANELADASLIQASIDQKINDIRLVPFSNAINLTQNKQYAKYAIVPLALLLGTLTLAPYLITESTNRLINNDKEFERQAPFQFHLPTDTFEVVQYADLTLPITVTGTALPTEAFINLNNYPYKLKKQAIDTFVYEFSKVAKTQTFYFESGGFKSKTYTLKVIPKPALLNFEVALQYPAYTERTSETLKNSGDLIVPAGTKITWNFETENTDNVSLKFGETSSPQFVEKQGNEGKFSLSKTINKETPYTLYLSNQKIKNADSVMYAISVIPDLYPTISATEIQDTTQKGFSKELLYFLGEATDDYGISSLNFKYKIENTTDQASASVGDFNKIPLQISNKRAAAFTHTIDIKALNLKPAQKLTYYFEVWDNDAVNGSKRAQTAIMNYAMPTEYQMDNKADQKNEEIKDNMEDLVKQMQQLQKDAKELRQDLSQKKEMNWQDKEQIQSMLNKQKELQQKIENMKEEFKQNIENQEQYKEFTESIKEKQEKLQEMFDKMLSEEMKDLFKKLEELLEKMQKENTTEELQNFEMDNKEIEQELDRMKELFKQLEMEQKITETVEKLNELAEQEEKLSEESEKNEEGDNKNNQDEQKKQDDIEKKFDELKKDIEDIDKKGEDIGKKMDMQKETKEDQQGAEKDMQQSQENMKSGENQSASKKQKNASKKMKNMATSMQMKMNKMQQEQKEEDMQAIRQLLENLNKLSFDQEALMNKVATTTLNTPLYVQLMEQQHKLKDDAKLVEDSLVALSKRVFEIESFVIKELTDMNNNIQQSIENLEQRTTSRAAANQQYTMTSLNNLSLLLDDALQQMQQAMAMQMPGNQSCQKPGGKGKGKPGMSNAQQQLNDQIKKLQQDMQQGKGGKNGKSGFSKEAAQLAAKQAAIKKALEEFSQKNKDGSKPGGELDDLKNKMEQTENDLINKQITAQTLKRQQEIMTRLLEAENADQQRDQDNKRESKTAQLKPRQTPPEIQEFLKKRQSETELYKTVPPDLKPYYKSLVEKYFKSISF